MLQPSKAQDGLQDVHQQGLAAAVIVPEIHIGDRAVGLQSLAHDSSSFIADALVVSEVEATPLPGRLVAHMVGFVEVFLEH